MSHSPIANWLVEKGIVKNASGAQGFMRGLICVNAVAIVAILLFAYLAPMQNESVNGIGIIHNEGASFVQTVNQFGWPSALAYLRFTSLVVVGDVLGALLALWLPIFVIGAVIVFTVIFYRRHPKNR